MHACLSFGWNMGKLQAAKKAAKKVVAGVKKGAKKAGYAGRVGAATWRLGIRTAIGAPKMLIDAARGEGMVLPGSKYIGPGNRMNKGKPKDKNDAAAYQHDVDYDNYIKKGVKKKHVYTGFSDADKRLMKKADLTKPSGVAVYGGMKAKQVLNKLGLTKRIRDKDVYGKK